MSNYLNTQLYKRKVRDTTFMLWPSCDWKKVVSPCEIDGQSITVYHVKVVKNVIILEELKI